MEIRKQIPNEPKKTFETMTPVNLLLKIFCGPIISQKKLRSKLRFFIVATNIIIGVVMSAYNIKKSNAYLILVDCDKFHCLCMMIISRLFDIMLYIIDLGYLFKFGGHIHLNYFELYDRIDQILGTTYNAIIKSKICKQTICLTFSSVMFIILSILYSFWFDGSGDMFFKISLTIEYIIRFKHSLTIIELCANIIQIEDRLKIITVKLKDLFSFGSTRLEFNVSAMHWLNSSNQKENSDNMVSENSLTELNGLQKSYLLLLEQNDHINQLFGVRVSENLTKLCYFQLSF